MSPHELLDAYRRLCQTLPFDVEDGAAVGRTFDAGRRGDARAREQAEVWAYLFLQRYFAFKFLATPQHPNSDLEGLLSETYLGLLGRMDQVRDAAAFPGWVSVSARRAYASYARSGQTALPLSETFDVPEETDAPLVEDLDAAFARAALDRAFETLPPALRTVARRRLLDEAAYETIAEETGHPVPTLRAYVKKALDRLRDDPHLRSVVGRG